MIWTLVVGVCLSLSILLVRLVWLSSSTPDLPFEDTVEQCEAALCVFHLLVDPKEEGYLRATLPPPEFRVLQAQAPLARNAVSNFAGPEYYVPG